MDHEVGPWKMVILHGSTSMVRYFKKKRFIKYLGFSLGVNQMWIKRNDHAPKSECVDFSNIRPKKVVSEKKI